MGVVRSPLLGDWQPNLRRFLRGQKEMSETNNESQTTIKIVKPMPRNRSYHKPKPALPEEKPVHGQANDDE
jgi:hypothetical protein